MTLQNIRCPRRWLLPSLLFGVLAGTLCNPAWSQESAAAKGKEPLALVGGKPIYDEDVISQMGAAYQQLRNQEYTLKKQALDQLVNQRLVEAEAAKKGVAALAFLQQEADSKVSDPTDAEVDAFYQGQKDQINRPLNEIRPQLRDALKQARVQQARQDLFDRLRANTEVSILLRSPTIGLGYDPARVRGDSKAPVTIIEFSDFQCPFCLRAYPTMKQLLSKYQGKVKLAYRDFPLRDIHNQAQLLAEAGRCALAQGKFWEYHDAVFENKGKLDSVSVKEFARNLKLDGDLFDFCLDGHQFVNEIEKDVQAGTNAGVSGTPAFFINGELVSGAQPIAVFEKEIDAALAAQSAKAETHPSPKAGATSATP